MNLIGPWFGIARSEMQSIHILRNEGETIFYRRSMSTSALWPALGSAR